MNPSSKTLVDLETRFWQSMVDGDHETAVGLLSEPAMMVSQHGALQFGKDDYRRMAQQGPVVVTSFEFDSVQVVFPNDDTAVLAYRVKQGVAPRDKRDKATMQEMNDSSTWIRVGGAWQCVMHTETPVAEGAKKQ